MQSARCISALLLMLMAAYVAFANAWCLIASAQNRRKGVDKHHSTVPLVSMILAALAYWLYPFQPKWWIFGVAALDLGNWALFLGVVTPPR